MSQGQSGSLLVPLIFIICLAILPGAGGFFLAIFVIIVIGAGLIERQRREDGKPMPDRRILKLPDPRLSTQDKVGTDMLAVNDIYGEEVYKTQPKRKDDPFRFSDERGNPGGETRPFDNGYETVKLPPKTKTVNDHPDPKGGTGDDSSGLVPRAILPYLFPVLGLAFLVLLAESETLFYAFAYLFWTTIIIGIGALIVLVLGGWPGLSIGMAIVAAYLTGSVIFTHQPSAGLVLAASAAWLVTCLLVRLFLKRKENTTSLLFLLAKNGTEFTLVSTAAAAVALMLPSVFAHVPLSRVLSWREHLDTVRKVLDKIALDSKVTLALVIGLLILQRAFPHSKWSAKLEPLWKTWDTGSDWLKRLGFVLTAIFCFSFTGNLHGNAVDTLQTEIKDLDKTYDELVWGVYLDLSAQLNIHAYGAAFDQLPTEAKQIIQRELDLNKAADRIPLMYFRTETPPPIDVELFFSDPEAGLEGDRELIDFRRSSALPAYPPKMPESFWRFRAPQETSHQRIEEAKSEVQKIKETRSAPSWMQGLGMESTDKFLELILDSDHLTFIHKLAEDYPALSELLDVVSKSLQEKLSSKLEESAERIAERRMENPSLTVSGLIQEEVASLEMGLDSGQAMSRIKAKEPELQDRAKLVEAAKKRFEKDLHVERNKELADMRAAENTLREVHGELGSKIDIESEEDLRDENVQSLQMIKARKLNYEAQLTAIVQRSKPVEQIELIKIIGANNYEKIIRSIPEKEPTPWSPTGPHERGIPGYEARPEDHPDRPPAEVPHYERPPV